MNPLQDIFDFIGASILALVIGFTTFFIMSAYRQAGPHHLGYIFQLPFYLHPGWTPLFFLVWNYYWLEFWKRLSKFLQDAATAKKVYRTSWISLALIMGLWVYLPSGQPHVYHFLQFNPGMKILRKAILGLLGISFPIVLSLTVLVVAGDLMGLPPGDPLERELFRIVPWKRRANHAKHSQIAATKGLTYVGYEVTWKSPVYLTPKERNEHVHVLGTTGSGKTRHVIFPMMRQDIQRGLGVVFIDAKGSLENAKAVYRMVKEAGREKDFLFFSLSPEHGSATYNPLRRGNSTQLQDRIAASIEWSEPYYQRVCEDALQTLFMDLQKLEQRVTLNDLHKHLKDPPASLPHFKELADQHQKEIQSLRSEIGLLVNTDFGHLFNKLESDIDLLDVYQKRKIVYFSLDTQSYPRAAMRVGKMITQDINTLSGLVESQKGENEKKPLAVYIDEFQAFGTKGFINALVRGRSSGLWITIAHQSLGDLKAIDPAFVQQVNDTTNTKLFLRVNDPETAQSFADFVGTGKKIQTTRQIHLQGKEPERILGSQRIVHEYIIHPTEVKTLGTGHAVFKCGRWSGRLILPGYFESVEGVELPCPVHVVAEPPKPEPPSKDPGQENDETGKNGHQGI